MENIYAARIAALRKVMASEGWDAVIITGTDPHNTEYPADRWKQVRWLSGFTGEAGDIVVTADHAGLWTDTRYFIQANIQLAGTGIELHKTRVPEEVPIHEWLGQQNVETVVIDGLCYNFESYLNIGLFKVINCPDLLSVLWKDRPQIPQTPIKTLSVELAGESRAEKIEWLRKEIGKWSCEMILLTSLDDIAWLLNVRGSDIDYNPFVISYLLVTMDRVCWYVRKDGHEDLDEETLKSFEELRADGIEIFDYCDLITGLTACQHDAVCLFADPASLNYEVGARILEIFGDGNVVLKKSPVPLRKAVKNQTEIEGFRKAYLEDGLAMEKFLYWLENAVPTGIDEWEASCKLTSLRAEIPGYQSESFETISAYGPGAALPHYITPRSGAPRLEPHGLYLVDSGGQYLFGTTDITRTVPLGPCTRLEREDYTLVLCGMINLASAVFPYGTPGCRVDALARMPLWKTLRNFGHGTGHGTGFFLGVHEGPQDIRQNQNNQGLLPGMVTSDEPGIYREGQHGVRHENVILCVDKGENEFGHWSGFETLTLCHFDTDALLPELMTREQIEWLNDYNEKVYRTHAPRLPENIAAWLREKTRPICL